MNPQDPLAALHPLRTPDAIGWWPPAPGWWLLALLAISAVVALVYLWRKHRRANAYRRQALAQLQQLQTDYQTHRDKLLHLGHINALLKSAALQAYPRSDIAAQHGEAWRGFLNSSLPADKQLPPEFATANYQPACPDFDLEPVHRATQHWLKHHKATL